MATIRAVPIGVGHFLPERIVTNSELAMTVDTNDEWIKTRTGIERRHFAADDEFTSDLAIKAAKNAGTFLLCSQNKGLKVMRARKIASKKGIISGAAACKE